MRIAILFLLALPAIAQSVFINAGGLASGAYSADRYFIGGATYTTTTPLLKGPPEYLRTERYGEFGYSIPVPDGPYIVTLHFLENAATAAAQRVFSVTINGQVVLPALDLFAAAGLNEPYDRSFPVMATGGRIQLLFHTILRNAIVNAIDAEAVPGVPVVGFRPTVAADFSFVVPARSLACYLNGMRQAEGEDYTFEPVSGLVTPIAGTPLSSVSGVVVCDYLPK